jgi:predicted transposase/invertase (TIGR01784 family)
MDLSKFLDIKNDIALKRIFSSERNKGILIYFLNDVSDVEEIKDIESIQDPEKKQSIVDVLCRDSMGVQFICGMQVAKTKGFKKRVQCYAAQAYVRQADRGQGSNV